MVDWLRRQDVLNCTSMAGGIDRWSLEVTAPLSLRSGSAVTPDVAPPSNRSSLRGFGSGSSSKALPGTNTAMVFAS